MELVEFVCARLDEDKAAARHRDEVTFGPEQRKYISDALHDPHDPARVLAQVAAMRAIVAEYERLDGESDQSDGLADLAARVAAAAAARDAVRHLATIWSGHEDYDPSWSPTA